jgi:hypothetical protein
MMTNDDGDDSNLKITVSLTHAVDWFYKEKKKH